MPLPVREGHLGIRSRGGAMRVRADVVAASDRPLIALPAPGSRASTRLGASGSTPSASPGARTVAVLAATEVCPPLSTSGADLSSRGAPCSAT